VLTWRAGGFCLFRTYTLKKNPLKNLGAMLKLNPYAKTARRAELLAQVQRSP
jgi:hypothetical protein